MSAVKPAMPLLNGRPYRAGAPFRTFRDPGRKWFGYINKIVVNYTDGLKPTSECMTLAAFNRASMRKLSGPVIPCEMP